MFQDVDHFPQNVIEVTGLNEVWRRPLIFSRDVHLLAEISFLIFILLSYIYIFIFFILRPHLFVSLQRDYGQHETPFYFFSSELLPKNPIQCVCTYISFFFFSHFNFSDSYFIFIFSLSNMIHFFFVYK